MKLLVVFLVVCLAGGVASRRELRQVKVSTATSTSSATGSVRTQTSTSTSVSTKVTTATKKKSNVIPGRAEVYFLVDLTEKKTAYVKELAKNADEFVEGLFGISEKFRFGLGTYTDLKDGSTFTPALTFTKDAKNVASAVKGLSAVKTSVGKESQFLALETIATDKKVASYRPKSKRIVVWIGNAEGKDPMADSTEKSVIDALKAKDINVLAIDTGSLDKTEQASRIVKATNGIFYKVDKDGKFVTVSLTSSSVTTSGTATATASATGGITRTATSTDGDKKEITTPVNLVDAIFDGIIALAEPLE